jgi:hypothetical protein
MSKYFTLEELIFSNDALTKYKIRNKTTSEVETNLLRLIEILDKIREKWGKPIQITSGYRCKELNDKIKGSKTSKHLEGLAADLDAGTNEDNKNLAKMIVKEGFIFDQLIDEKNYAWVHFGLTNKNKIPRKEILRYDGKKYIKINFNQL